MRRTGCSSGAYHLSTVTTSAAAGVNVDQDTSPAAAGTLRSVGVSRRWYHCAKLTLSTSCVQIVACCCVAGSDSFFGGSLSGAYHLGLELTSSSSLVNADVCCSEDSRYFLIGGSLSCAYHLGRELTSSSSLTKASGCC